ncbi:MAG TPA: NADP-dependent oxidoreductase [Rhizomicrobium sp.]|nr:NADP-dependent oxidoreductase [Rhizomicrobium sp.]
MPINRQWLLKRRPQGKLSPADFEYRETEMPDPTGTLEPGELLIRNRLFACAPAMRNALDQSGNGVFPPMELGTPVVSPAGGEVLASARDGIVPGAHVVYMGRWQDFQKIGASEPMSPIPEGMELIEAMGSNGANAITAYVGLIKVGQPRAGQTLVVSAAAGSTGATAAQIGKIVGCRVIGIAGGEAKCKWLREQLHLDETIDYRRANVEAEMRRLCPNGIDIYFDNVGGEILTAAVENMAPSGRIVLCGQIAKYDGNLRDTPHLNMMRLIYLNIRIEGFTAGPFLSSIDEARGRLKAWTAEGKLIHQLDIHRGFKSLPETYGMLFDGRNNGTLLVAND